MFPPTQFSRKGEDLIWKKGFYDLITQVYELILLGRRRNLNTKLLLLFDQKIDKSIILLSFNP